MNSQNTPDDHQAYHEVDEPPSVVEENQPFRAEVAKRSNKRALIGGAFLVLAVIASLVIAGVLIKNWRESFAAERAAREKASQEKLDTGRRSKRFDDRPDQELTQASNIPTPPPPAEVKVPPLPPGIPAAPERPTPVAAPPKPMPPPMLDWGAADGSEAGNQATAAAAAASAMAGLPAQGSHGGGAGKTVQAQAGQQAAGKPATATLQASAAALGDRSYLLARGGAIPCILETQLNSTVAGNTSCVIPENVYSDDGKALLIEKGSKGQGSFGSTLKVGDQRIAVLWSRIKTTRGIVIDVDSPAADGVGTTGAGGYVDNHWVDRIGAAVLLSFVEDGMAYATARAQNSSSDSATGANSARSSSTNVFLPSNSIGATRQLAEKILDSTINIPPTLYKNRGDRIMIYVNKDLWFDSTYQLVKAQ